MRQRGCDYTSQVCQLPGGAHAKCLGDVHRGRITFLQVEKYKKVNEEIEQFMGKPEIAACP
tara:strand:+ start:415 stop:597 length:183 start_codon:yes stop_codon:yes gene_type:complete